MGIGGHSGTEKQGNMTKISVYSDHFGQFCQIWLSNQDQNDSFAPRQKVAKSSKFSVFH